MTALVALIASALAAAVAPSAHAKKRKKAPVITSVQPKDVAVGETLTIRGRNFIRGRSRNTVVFKRDGARAVFVKADVGTRKMLRLQVPDSLQEFFQLNAGNPVPTRFRLRVLARKFGKKFTSDSLSPIVSAPRPLQAVQPVAALPDGDCDGDGTKNRYDGDDDNDGLADDVELSLSLDPCKADTDGDGLIDKWEFDCDRNGVLNRDQADDDSDLLDDGSETAIGTNPCALDSDGDGVEDGYEYQSAKDLNDDEYQGDPNQVLPYPGKRPYPNPLFADANLDYDGDVLTLAEEQALWKYTYSVNGSATRSLDPLSYSDGNQHSVYTRVAGRRQPSLNAAGYNRQAQFLAWAGAPTNNYLTVLIPPMVPYPAPDGAVYYDIRDANLNGGNADPTAVDAPEPVEVEYYDLDGDGKLADDERDEDADGLTNYDETHGRMTPQYWAGCYSMEAAYGIGYAGPRVDDADSDGDGVLDGADDQDHDDLPNLMELSRYAASGLVDWQDGSPCRIKSGIVFDETDLNGDGKPDNPKRLAGHFYGRVNPFNPCLPGRNSRTCQSHPSFAGAGAPFDDSPDWLSLDR
jgi:hypothetical protein